MNVSFTRSLQVDAEATYESEDVQSQLYRQLSQEVSLQPRTDVGAQHDQFRSGKKRE